ncbi:hypothetical protein PFICI_02180 [Pestalotiopsis fici W106-1]|uniref:Phytanoyl-CoA dioxygenase n=1 Tax=Pestalotiopsis fici (strain W106-1 / CGMCC3.15140) TaxID=1229662 RepID=W3XDM6_PESFW|nr:uncharacterized protein PFICI_02180 [Pestalotiopsis fici W106-1]ETS84155.1 hypothetical protein PFICI_02180 [Pestalotiopsis fici W106-1]
MTQVHNYPSSPLQAIQGSKHSSPQTAANPEILKLRGTDSDIDGVRPLVPCSLDTQLEELQRLYEQDGVIWVKNLLPRDLVLKCRENYMHFVNETTFMLKPGTDPVEGIFDPSNDWREFLPPGVVRVAAGFSDDGPFVEAAIKAHKAPFYLKFKDEVAKIIEPFVGKLRKFKEPWCLPRSLLRCAVPGAETTPVHYDQIYLRAGPPTSITGWVPIGDIGPKGGGLVYLDNAHDIGVKYEQDFDELNKDLPDEERLSAFNKNMEKGGWLDRNAGRFGQGWNRGWLVGDYEAGDVVFHSPYSIHASAINEDPCGRVRVSTDLRFVDKTKPFDQRWTVPAFDKNDTAVVRKANLSQ